MNVWLEGMGLGFLVWGLWFSVYGLRLGFGLYDLGFKNSSLGFGRAWGHATLQLCKD